VTAAEAALAVDRARGLALLAAMVRVRALEERCAEDYAAQKIRGFLHLYVGQEAVAAGVLRCLTPDDAVIATYREHAHALLRGIPARAVMAEMYGKAAGCSGGRGGSMHLYSAAHRFYGGHAIVAGLLPVAVGLALADRVLGRSTVTAAFFGEGAVAEGEFHEALNLASLWRLPVLLVCENNLYAMGTALERSQAEPQLHRKAAAHRVDAEVVDGMDALAVEDAAARAVARIRRTGSPWFLECRTYRFRAHSMFDPELYRDPEEVRRWRQRDPIDALARRLRTDGLLDDADLAGLRAAAAAELADACAFADAAPPEPLETLLRDVVAEPGAPCRVA
jgi:pyruvate dehydrogenase E1 component alpha subunit